MKPALVAAALILAVLAVTFPAAHASWLKWPVVFGTAMSDDLAEAKSLTREACGENSQSDQEVCQNAKRILIALERRAT